MRSLFLFRQAQGRERAGEKAHRFFGVGFDRFDFTIDRSVYDKGEGFLLFLDDGGRCDDDGWSRFVIRAGQDQAQSDGGESRDGDS